MRAKELLYIQLISIHNIYTINTLMEDIRSGIDQNDMSNVKAKWL